MSPLTNKQTITPSTPEDTSVKPLEKEILQSTSLAKGIHFFSDQCIIRVANKLEIRQKAYELLHGLYLKMGYTQNNDKGLWLTIYDALPETTTFVAEDERGRCVGALTVVFDSPIGLPADELYKKEIDIIRNSGGKICEFVSLGIDNGGRSSIKFL
ncbi:MAG: hypothetical protein PVJ56_15795, partial [Desulfobacterales bacterium]